MKADIQASRPQHDETEHEPRVSWLDVTCAWMAVLALGLLGLLF